MSWSLPLWARIGLFFLGLFCLLIALWALAVPYTNGEGDDCDPVYRGGGTPNGTDVVMEGAHDACDLERTDRIMITAVAVNGAAVFLVAGVLLRAKHGPAGA